MNIVDPVRRKALPAVAKAAAAVVVLLAAYVLIESATHRKAPGAAETPGPVAGELDGCRTVGRLVPMVRPPGPQHGFRRHGLARFF